MYGEKIQYFMADAVKAHLGEGPHRILHYSMPCTKMINALRMLYDTNQRNSVSLMAKESEAPQVCAVYYQRSNTLLD